ncbi:MAG: hypothetical protein AAFV53_07705 [Myxococcota bacterium]
MSLNNLHLVPLAGLGEGRTVGQLVALDHVRLPAGGWAYLDGERMILDLPHRALVIRQSTGEILDDLRTEGMSLLGIDVDRRYAVFSEDLSWSYQLYDLRNQVWLDNPDPDFPRFILEEDGDDAWIIDLDSDDRMLLEEVPPIASRQTA